MKGKKRNRTGRKLPVKAWLKKMMIVFFCVAVVGAFLMLAEKMPELVVAFTKQKNDGDTVIVTKDKSNENINYALNIWDKLEILAQMQDGAYCSEVFTIEGEKEFEQEYPDFITDAEDNISEYARILMIQSYVPIKTLELNKATYYMVRSTQMGTVSFGIWLFEYKMPDSNHILHVVLDAQNAKVYALYGDIRVSDTKSLSERMHDNISRRLFKNELEQRDPEEMLEEWKWNVADSISGYYSMDSTAYAYGEDYDFFEFELSYSSLNEQYDIYCTYMISLSQNPDMSITMQNGIMSVLGYLTDGIEYKKYESYINETGYYDGYENAE